MTESVRVPVEGRVLIWARESAGLDLYTAAQRAGVGANRLAAWELNDDSVKPPTLNQVRKLSTVYFRPLGALFMTAPPAEEIEELPDYRRPAVASDVEPRALQKAIVRARRQRADLVEIADSLQVPAEDRLARFQFEENMSNESIADDLRTMLSMPSFGTTLLRRPEEFLRELIRASESLNVVVAQVQSVDSQLMRGMSLSRGPYPIIVLNGAEWPRGKIFTLLHELVHVGLRADGLCDLQQETDSAVERLCDSAAASALMPEAAFRAAAGPPVHSPDVPDLMALGDQFGASGEAALLRLIDLGLASWDDYRRLQGDFREAYAHYRQEMRDSRDPQSPLYYQLKVRDLGRSFVRRVLQAYGEDAISSRDLTKMLDVKYDKVPRVAAQVGQAV